jgi:hypothetical protein
LQADDARVGQAKRLDVGVHEILCRSGEQHFQADILSIYLLIRPEDGGKIVIASDLLNDLSAKHQRRLFFAGGRPIRALASARTGPSSMAGAPSRTGGRCSASLSDPASEVDAAFSVSFTQAQEAANEGGLQVLRMHNLVLVSEELANRRDFGFGVPGPGPRIRLIDLTLPTQ